VDRLKERELQGGALIQAPGHLRTYTSSLAVFDLGIVHTLELVEQEHNKDEGEVICQQLSRCPQLRALRLDLASFQPKALQVIADLPQLQLLCLGGYASPCNPPLDSAIWLCWQAAAGS
jgi:hypothetical protein